MRKLLLFGGCSIALAVALSACGGSESEEEQIVSAIETLATSTDPADCEALATLNFMEQTEVEEGEDAVQSCEEDAEDGSDNPDSVAVTNVEVDGPNAMADVAFDGGDLDRQTVTIGLVEVDGSWKLDQLERFVVFDRETLLGNFREEISEEASAEEKEVANCLIEELEGSSDEEIEEIVLSPELFVQLAEESCV